MRQLGTRNLRHEIEALEKVLGEQVLQALFSLPSKTIPRKRTSEETLSDRERLLHYTDFEFITDDFMPFHAWTESYVIFCVQYDGNPSIAYLPRNPTLQITPEFFGGG